MSKLHFSIDINAPREKVWETMLNDTTYREWTKDFNPASGSYYEGSWDQGATIKFLGPDKDGTVSGLIGHIKENRLHEFLSVEYDAEIVKGEEKANDSWKGATENYTFNEKDGGTELVIDLESTSTDMDFMKDLWPKALAKLKELSEK